MYEANREVSKYRRRFEYLGEVLTGRESVEERTLFGYTDGINKKREEQYEIKDGGTSETTEKVSFEKVYHILPFCMYCKI